MARQDQMADDDAAFQFFAVPLRRAHLGHHLPDGGGGHFKIISRTGQRSPQGGIGVF